MFHVGVDNEQHHERIAHRHQFGLARAAVEQEKLTFAAKYGNELIHDAAGNTG